MKAYIDNRVFAPTNYFLNDLRLWRLCLAVALMIGMLPTSWAGEKFVGDTYFTKPFWNLRYTYRFKFAVERILDVGSIDDCGKEAATTYSAGKDSIFVEHSRVEENGVLMLIGEFTYANNIGTTRADSVPVLGKPYMVCIGAPTENNSVTADWAIRRAGGVDTGVLVIPFKVRQGDLFSDSTIGPYFAFSGSTFTLLTTFGLTQVTVKASNETDVKTETGLTVALGAVWRLKKDWDIGLVVGADHLSGEAGQNFKFQNKPWWSFAIGYQFKQ